MNALRAFMAILFAVIVIYTVLVIAEHGPAFLVLFFEDIAAMTWNGQFNLDFLGFLTLSALWVAWRNGFTPVGLLLALGAFFLGVPFLTGYLLVLSFRTDGDAARILLGDRRAAA